MAVRWVDKSNGDSDNHNYRSRLVAQAFAAMPPSRCPKLILSKLASDRKYMVLYADVPRAYF